MCVQNSLLKDAVLGAAAVFGPHAWPTRQQKLWVLMYHRVLPLSDPRSLREESGMTITPRTFLSHLLWLAERFEIVKLADWLQAAMGDKPLPKRACALTFDDGWRDNYEFALPELVAEGVPATIFAVSHMIGGTEIFWPNRLARLLTRLGSQAAFHPALSWIERRSHVLARGRTPDRNDIAAVVATCKNMAESELTDHLTGAELMLGGDGEFDRELLSWDEVRSLLRTDLVDIGSHTRRHVRLTEQTPRDIVAAEITESRAELERQLGVPIRLFCYPNGDACAYARDLVRDHYLGAVTTRCGINTRLTSSYELMRIGLHEDVSCTRRSFFARLSGWF
jgi:peptidoglycan/xylan/chitin deacetylase (PgdA/CDA1 family)